MGTGETESQKHGRGRSKKLEGEETSDHLKLLAQLEEAVRNAVTDTTDDMVLARLIEITIRAIHSKHEFFDNLLEEPVFYVRHFRPWVEAALAERDALEQFHSQALKNLGLTAPHLT